MATTFTPFPLLPTEIRLQIWAFAQPARILKIHIEPDFRIPERPLTAMTNFHAYASRLSRPFYFKSLNPPPAMLAVNHESREVILRSYVVVRDDSGPRLFYNSMRDTLWVEQHEYPDDWAMLAERISKSGVQVKSLAIQHDGLHHGLYQPDFAKLVMHFGIRQLFLVCKEGKRIPRVWPLFPRTRENNGIDARFYMEGVGNRSIVRQFESLDKVSDGGSMPRVTAVERALWEEEGLQLSEQAPYEVVIGEVLFSQPRRLMGLYGATGT